MTMYDFSEPFDRLRSWLDEAQSRELNDPNAVYIASLGDDGQPSLRTVLLKGLDTRGLVFYTNFESRKGRELQTHPKTAALFHWKSLERQIRVEGRVEKISDEEADAYFISRARGSQIGAHASLQSQPMPTPDALEMRIREIENQYNGQQIPRPSHWSGFRLIPDYFEFWQAGAFRLHDREVLTKSADGWVGETLFP